MKSILLAVLFIPPVTVFASSTEISTNSVMQSKLSDVTLEESKTFAILLSPAENTFIVDEIGFSKKASLFKSLSSNNGEALKALIAKYPAKEFPHTADLIKVSATQSLEDKKIESANSK